MDFYAKVAWPLGQAFAVLCCNIAILTCFYQGHPGLTYRHHCRHAALWRHQCVASGHAIPKAAQKQSQRHSADSASGILGSIFAQPEVRELEKTLKFGGEKKIGPSPSPRAASNRVTPFDSS